MNKNHSLKKILFFFSILLVSISSIADTVTDIQERYNKEVNQCGDKPAYMCSGVIIRALSKAEAPPKYSHWEFPQNTSSYKKQAVSFSFLRKDLKFGRFFQNYGSGFILKPNSKNNLLCGFPIDAWTNERKDLGGCGQSFSIMNGVQKVYYQDSKICNSDYNLDNDEKTEYRNITATQAMEDKNICKMEMLARKQCGFSFQDNTTAKDRFIKMINVQKSIGSVRYNEVMVPLVKDGTIYKFEDVHEIEAYFYLTGIDEASNKASAQLYLDYYKAQTNKNIPLIKVTILSSGIKFENP